LEILRRRKLLLTDLKKQIALIWQITVSPRQAFLIFPSDRLLPVAFMISFYFSFARIMREGLFGRLSTDLNSSLFAFLIFLIVGFIVFSISGAVLRLLIRVLGKKLTTRTVLNIIGYSQSPRLFLSVPLSILLALAPDALLVNLFGPSSTLIGIILTAIGAPFLIYSIILLIWGLIASPDERQSQEAETGT
jgi:hypothetical protein